MKQQTDNQALKLDPTRTKTIGNYVLGKTIGKGTFGKVKLATHILTGEKVAVKILQKQRIVDVADVERVNREIHILKLIRHPGIIQLYDIIETPKHLFLIMEYMEGGELFDHIVKCKKVPEEEACRIFQQIIGGVQYIHKLNIVHRDLKPQNLLIDYDNSIRIVDFGLSNIYRKCKQFYDEEQRLKTACGSPCYAAPEMIEGKNKYEPIFVDIWSCGVILYAMLCGCLPFEDPETSKLYQKILAGQYKIPKTLSNDAKDLISKILTVDPTKRYRIEEIRKHKWWKIASMENNYSHGIIVGFNKIPVETCILDEAVKLGFEYDFTKKCIEANRHDNITTTYYLLLKKFVKEGGHSTASLNSKYFDPLLIQPVKKNKATITSLSDNSPNDSSPHAITKTLQANITRRNYIMQKQKINKDKTDHSITKFGSREIVTPSNPSRQINRRGRSLNSREKIQSIKEDTTLYETGNNIISNKYRQTYGTSLISKSKEKSRRKSKANQISSIYEKGKTLFHFNQTIEYNKTSKNKHRIGADLGYQTINNTIDHQSNRPYLRRIVYH